MSRLATALVRWQHAAGPWWPYVCAAPFLGSVEGELLAAGAYPSRPVRGRRLAEARALVDWLVTCGDDAATIDGSPLVVLVDAPSEPVLAVVPLLVARGWYVVPVIQRWIARPAVLPCGRLLRQLVDGAWQVHRPTAPRGVILIADGERMGTPGYPSLAPGRAFDNRYEYQVCRFPSIDFLRGQDVRSVRWVTDRPDGLARPDLAPYLEDLLRDGLSVELRAWPGRETRGAGRGARGEG